MTTEKQLLIERAKQVRDEHREGANSAYRVGQLMMDMIDLQPEIDLSGAIENALEQANAYTDQALEQANAYSDQILVLANAYTDIEVGKVRQEIDSLDERYLRRDVPDTAEGLITFNQGIRVYELARMLRVEVTQLATIAQAVVQVLRSSRFVDGFLGEGYQLWKAVATGDWCLTIDRLTVRKMMTIYELVIQKLRSVGGAVVVSAANGRIREVACADGRYRITFEDANQFRPGDLMRCQTLTGASTKYYWVEVQAVEGDAVTVPVSEFAGVLPEAGDEVVLMGNTTDVTRQSLLLLSATEDGQPRFDCYDGVHARNLDGCLRVRTGCLDGISDSRFPATNQPHGYGLYGSNCYLTGTFVLSTGQEVRTLIEAVEGRISAEVSSVRREVSAADNYLYNASFSDNMAGWQHGAEAAMYTVGGQLVTDGLALMGEKDAYAGLVEQDGLTLLRIRGSYIRQANADLARRPSFQAKEDAGYAAKRIYLTIRAKVLTAGTLSVRWDGESDEGFEPYAPLDYSAELVPAEGFEDIETTALWSGTGDFLLSYSGDMLVYALYVTDNPVEELDAKYTARFEMTDKLIKTNVQAITRLDSRLTSAETTIDQTAYAVSLCATRSELNTVSGNLATHTASFHVTADKITSMVSSIDANASSISSLEQTASSLSTSIASTKQTADAARTAADEAASQAAGALSAANAAQVAADAAQSTADSALSKAGTNATAIQQTKDSISVLAGYFDNEGHLIEGAGWVTTAQGNLLWATKDAVTDLQGRMTSAETRITQTESNITLCATKTELNTVSGNLATHTASFHVSADKITSMVSSIDANASSISSLEQTASSLSTSIASTKQTADAARTAADEAASQAAGALSAANAAQVAADAAQSTADSALSKAGTNATAIQQTKDSISVLAGYFDNEGHLIEGAGWVTTAQGNLLWATKDAVTDLQGRMTSAETRITQTESSISLCATKTELDTVSGNLATHTSSFHVTADKITSIVSSIDANSSSISSLEQTANSITLQVASSNKSNRNYLLKSGTEVTASTYRIAGYTPAIPLTPSITYTVQLMVTVPSGVDQIAVYLSSGMIKQASWSGLSAGKQLLTATFAAKYYSGMTPGDSAAYAVVELYQYYKGTQATKSVTVHWAKVELGSTATPWCPAPEEETAGRNYYGIHLDVTAYNSASVSRGNSNAPNGLYIVGASSGNGWLRISKAIDGNGYWTVSFWMRGSQSVAGGFNIDMCDTAPLNGNVRVAFRNDNQWVRIEKTFYITNYTEATYHFIDFQNIDWLYIYVKDLKVERGTKATAWCPPVEDSAATKAEISLFVTESEVGTLISNAVIRADQIDLVGKVTLTHLDSTIIDGGKIKTSLIDVDNLTVKSCANIGQFTVDSYGLTTTSSTARIAFEWSTNRFIRMNSAETAMFYARNDNGKLMELNAYGSGATALTLLANTSGSGYALSSTGMSRMVARYTSELNTVTGLALGVKSGTTFTGATNVGNTASWVDFLVATGNITLPKASDCPGKIIFIKITGGSRTISSSSTIYKCGDSGTYTSESFNNRALFFISNGTAWYEFACYQR